MLLARDKENADASTRMLEKLLKDYAVLIERRRTDTKEQTFGHPDL
jgi:hypothetical protein